MVNGTTKHATYDATGHTCSSIGTWLPVQRMAKAGKHMLAGETLWSSFHGVWRLRRWRQELLGAMWRGRRQPLLHVLDGERAGEAVISQPHNGKRRESEIHSTRVSGAHGDSCKAQTDGAMPRSFTLRVLCVCACVLMTPL